MVIFTSGEDFKKFWDKKGDFFVFDLLLRKDLRGKIRTRKLSESLEYEFVFMGEGTGILLIQEMEGWWTS